jgi:hypothetical protein
MPTPRAASAPSAQQMIGVLQRRRSRGFVENQIQVVRSARCIAAHRREGLPWTSTQEQAEVVRR